jgi:AraC-like DNA-binding protein
LNIRAHLPIFSSPFHFADSRDTMRPDEKAEGRSGALSVYFDGQICTDHTSVVATRCHQVPPAVVQPFQSDDYAHLHVVRRGCFHVRGSRVDALADPATAVFLMPYEHVETDHPQGDDADTVIAVSAHLLARIGNQSDALPAAVPVPASAFVLHEDLLSTIRGNDDVMRAEELAIIIFARLLAMSEPSRVTGTAPRRTREQRIVDDARMALIGDPTISSVVQLGKMVGCSPNHLSRLFSAHTGKGVASYRMSLRIRAALSRISGGESDLARLAQDLGFSDHAHLSRTVRKHLGTTPSTLRARWASVSAAAG